MTSDQPYFYCPRLLVSLSFVVN